MASQASGTSRERVINEVLFDLARLKERVPASQHYAVDANIEFFKVCRSILTYISWLCTRATKLDGSKLLEINDLLPKWDQTMHRKLIEMEKKKFPGLIKLLVNKLYELVTQADSDIVIADIGSGGMEAERQVIERLIRNKYPHRVLFVGIDQSLDARTVAKENLLSLGSDITQVEVDQLTAEKLVEITPQTLGQFVVVHCRNDIFALDEVFGSSSFDIAFHTLFKHHLTPEQRDRLDQILDKVAGKILEYDGFRDYFGMIPQSFIGWNNPVFLNAEIFSNIRFLEKKNLPNIKGRLVSDNIKFSKIGYYLSIEK
jgi:hypothetical protein